MAESSNRQGQPDTQEMLSRLRGSSFPVCGKEGFLEIELRDFFDELFLETEDMRSDIIRKAGISRTYGYQIMDGTRAGKRDYYISIAIAMGLDLRQTQRMLALSKRGCLHPLIKRDAAMIFALNHGYDHGKLHEFLVGLGLEPLDTGTE